jgi:hypothetical protein
VPSNVKKLPASLHRFALPLGTSFFMTFLVSGVATWRAIGPGESLLHTWMGSWMISWAIAAPTMYFMMPVVRRALRCVIEEE